MPNSREVARRFRIVGNRYYWETALLITRGKLAKQYHSSFLGTLWTLMPSLVFVTIYAIIMPMILKVHKENFILYIISTIPLWTFISASFGQAGQSLIAQAEALKRCMVSPTVFPVSDVLRNIYIYCGSFGIMYLGALLFGYPASWHILLLPLYLIPVALSVMAITIGIAFISPYARDIGEMVSLGLGILFWFSGVIYTIESAPPLLQLALELNPIYILLEPAISIIYHHQIPSAAMTLSLLGVLGLSVAFGYTLYQKFRRNFVYYL